MMKRKSILHKGLIMPDKHFYFSIGATIGTALSYYLIIARAKLEKNYRIIRMLKKNLKYWILYFPILIFLIGLWGLIPDLIHASGLLEKEVTRGPIFNLFFFHSLFEEIEDTYPVVDRYLNWTGSLLLLAISIFSMLFYIKIIKRNIRINQRG